MPLTIRQTETFARWLRRLKDRQARVMIAERIVRLENGHFGDVKRFDGIGELRIALGPGYRVYFVQDGETVVILLCGGNKGSQKRDIQRAKKLAGEIQP